MSDTTPAEPQGEPAAEPAAPATEPEGDKPLGEGGIKALNAERDARETAEKQVKDLQAQLDGSKSQIDGILTALGLNNKEEVDPDKLARDFAATSKSEQNLRVENSILRLAGKHGADPDALVDSRSFMDEVSKLDPNADDFTTKLTEAIQAKVKAVPAGRTAKRADSKELKSGTTGKTTPDANPKAAAAEALRRLRNGG